MEEGVTIETNLVDEAVAHEVPAEATEIEDTTLVRVHPEPSDRRDYGRDRDRDHGERRRDDRDDYKRDERRDRGARDDRREPRDAPRSDTTKPPPPKRDEPSSHGQDSRQTVTPPHNDNDTPNPESMDGVEDGEAPEVADDDAAMMAMMGMAGFGSTKGKHVEGNQEGGVNVKKIRTWRQYMNRRGGFNRPLDKIK
ncbi:hypothetical protein ONZ45_g19234 [Pleurotus djamor]|nr:hypothetical protein ONZ45_g19234 [Pleurotus djamor]